MVKITKIIFILLSILLLVGHSNAATNETLEQDIDDLPLPDYGPHIFEEIQNEDWFIASRGTMPTINNNSEKLEWAHQLGQSISYYEVLSKHYHEFGGPIVGVGVSINGYVEVGFNSDTPERINESYINEIYQILDEEYEKEGIDSGNNEKISHIPIKNKNREFR
jgi:hypothetical protein